MLMVWFSRHKGGLLPIGAVLFKRLKRSTAGVTLGVEDIVCREKSRLGSIQGHGLRGRIGSHCCLEGRYRKGPRRAPRAVLQKVLPARQRLPHPDRPPRRNQNPSQGCTISPLPWPPARRMWTQTLKKTGEGACCQRNYRRQSRDDDSAAGGRFSGVAL